MAGRPLTTPWSASSPAIIIPGQPPCGWPTCRLCLGVGPGRNRPEPTHENDTRAIVSASRIAIGTHLEEKLEALKHCLTHMVLGEDNGAFLDLVFIRFIDELTPEHFLVLSYFEDPKAWFEARGTPLPNLYMGSPKSLWETAGLPVAGVALDIIVRDLSDRGLANTTALSTTMTGEGVFQSMITDLGRRILVFISAV